MAWSAKCGSTGTGVRPGETRLPAVRSIRCCRTASTVAGSSTRTSTIRASMRRSSTRRCGTRCSGNLRPTVSTCATGTHAAEPSLLAGLIYDDSGQLMTPSHANKKGTRYRYYVSQALVSGIRRSAPRARRVPASDVERLVQERLTVFLKSQGEIFDAVEPFFDDVNRRQQVVDLAADLAARWPDLEPATKRQIFERLVSRINLTQETLEIRIAPSRLLEILREEDNPKTFEPALWDNELTVTFTVPAHLKRAGMETRLLIEGADGSARKSPDRSLLRLLRQAQRFHKKWCCTTGAGR